MNTLIGAEAITKKGWLKSHRWLLLRRITQISILLLFLLGNFNIFILKGNLSSSVFLDTLPMTDPYLFLQILLTQHYPETQAFLGVLFILICYLIIGGRSYCAWVCPMNIITDSAYWLRYRLNIKNRFTFSRQNRYWLLLITFISSLLTGSLLWELINPVSVLHRGIIFGMGMGWLLILGIFLLDLLIAKRAWCGHLCPVGAFYSLLGKRTKVFTVSAQQRDACNDCMECFVICPEPQVITPALKGAKNNISPNIHSEHCTHCGRCIDICSESVFNFQLNSKNNNKGSSL